MEIGDKKFSWTLCIPMTLLFIDEISEYIKQEALERASIGIDFNLTWNGCQHSGHWIQEKPV